MPSYFHSLTCGSRATAYFQTTSSALKPYSGASDMMLFKFGKFFKHQFEERVGMNKDKIKVNNHLYSVALNEQTQMYARKLRGLYQQGYSDVDSFDEVSSEISITVNNLLKRSVSPEVREEDMDGVVQHLLKVVDKAKKNIA